MKVLMVLAALAVLTVFIMFPIVAKLALGLLVTAVFVHFFV